MRPRLAALLLALVPAFPAMADDQVVQTYHGSETQTTSVFQVSDHWSLSWDVSQGTSIAVFASDGSVVAGVQAVGKGSLYQPTGGSFYLHVTPTDSSAAWQVTVTQLGSGPATNSAFAYVPPAVSPTNASSATPPTVAATLSSAGTNSAAASSSSMTLNAAQSRAVVIIKGDVAEGTGFLVKMPDGLAVITNQHVIAANPNIRILTQTGVQIETTALKGASDRDLAMFMIKDAGYSYLELNTDIKDTVASGDAVVTPGNSEGGEVVLATPGAVLGLGADRVEISNPIFHGNSGGPVLHGKSGKVIGVVTEARKVKTNDAVDKASFENKDSAITGAMRYFALRVDTVPEWQTLDWNRYLSETAFLKAFHETSRSLDSFMNGALYEKAQLVGGDPEEGPPSSRYYQRNDKLQEAHDSYHHLYTDGDDSQRLDASRELSMDLEGVADTDMTTIQDSANFYSFDQVRAKQEIKYRQELRDEIEKYANKLSDEGH